VAGTESAGPIRERGPVVQGRRRIVAEAAARALRDVDHAVTHHHGGPSLHVRETYAHSASITEPCVLNPPGAGRRRTIEIASRPLLRLAPGQAPKARSSMKS